MNRLVLCLSLALAASCDSDPSDSMSSRWMNGHVYLSPVGGATVACHSVLADGTMGPMMASATTDATGAFSFELPPDYSGPLILVCTQGQYVEEYGGAVVTVSHPMMCGVLPGSTRVAVTPFTSMMCALALSMGGYTEANLAHAAQRMSGYCGFDVTSTMPVNVLQPMGMMMGPGQAQIDYGLLLGAMSQTASSMGTTSCGLMAMAMDDLGDGDFDGPTMTTTMASMVANFSGSAWNVCGGSPSAGMMASLPGGVGP